MTLGAVSGGILMQIGRRKSIFIVASLSITGCLICIKLNFTAIMIGRFVYGFASGLYTGILPRMLEENTPP